MKLHWGGNCCISTADEPPSKLDLELGPVGAQIGVPGLDELENKSGN